MSEKRNRLLVVDDNVMNLQVLMSILQPEYLCYAAKSGADALEIAKAQQPDVILLDVIMPDMDGYTVLAILKSTKETKDIPVIYITGLDNDDDEKKGLALGAADYISKPFNETILKLRIRHQVQIVNQFRTNEILTKNLEAAKKQAEAANAAKSNFLAKMSHEIRTPLSAVLGISEMLLYNENLTPEAKEGIYRIHSTENLLLGIINDILDISKIESGNLELSPEKYDVAELISSTASLNMMHLKDRPIKFKLSVDDQLPAAVIGDALRVKQILNNLLSNAAKYTNEGEVLFKIYPEQTPNDSSRVYIVFVVQDTGFGMTEEQAEKLFDEYARFHENVERTIEGTGLGMNITKNLIRMMDGEISVESKPGKGTKVTVYIPQKKTDGEVIGRETADSLEGQRVEQVFLKNRKFLHEPMPYGKVLVVDDMESNLYVAKGLLGLYSLQIETAASGHEALSILKSREFDLVLMDHMMPQMDGIETVQKLREAGYTKPVAALTANALVGQENFFEKCGFDDFISKPIDMRQMDILLKKLVRDKIPPEARGRAPDSAVLDPILIEAIIRDAEKALSVFDSAMEKRFFFEVEELRLFTVSAHAMKTALAQIGEAELGKKAHALERAGIAGNTAAISADTPSFIAALREAVAKITPEKQDDEGIDEDIASLLEKLKYIKEACEMYNPGPADKALTELRQKSWRAKTKSALSAIDTHLLSGEYEEAAEAAGNYIKELER